MLPNKHIISCFIFTGLITALLFLASCSALMSTTTGGNGEKKVSSLTESSYAAADMLIQQSRSFVSQETPIEIGILVDIDNPNERTNFGNVVSGQIASRFVQLGYNVVQSPFSVMMPATGIQQGEQQGALPAPPATTGRRSISGHYVATPGKILVSLRIIELDTGKLVAAYDYTLSKSRDIRELIKTKADKNSFF